MSTKTVTFIMNHDEWGLVAAKVQSPFEAKDIIKEVPFQHRKWNADQKVWEINVEFWISFLMDKLKRSGFQVILVDPANLMGNYEPPKQKRGALPHGWADVMFGNTDRALHAPLYKALTRVLHPDFGGDEEQMKDLNAARDRVAASPRHNGPMPN